uniref:Flagellar FliJ protein n=1 Tax=Fundidesulfovibrio putealis TaxID=270496 RepID=A0A7C4EJ86_9BACT
MPRPFKFPLQKVLEYRAQLEDQAKQALAAAQAAHARQEAAVRNLERAREAQRREMAGPAARDAASLWLGRNYLERLEGDLAQAVETLAQLAQDVQIRRAELAQRAKDRKLLEKLKETQAIRHEREENRIEQAGFDEMATLRYQAPVV